MSETFLNDRVELRCGDCLEAVRAMPDCSVDSVVTDPPYALVSIGKRFGSATATPAKGNDAYMRASAGFMGKQWDTGEVAFAVEFWREILRVLKPGGHVVAFSGTRTYHRMAVAIEDAGFEIRDQLAWMYGSGFPKSHDVSKGIQKRRTEDDQPVRAVWRAIRAAMDCLGLKSRHMVEHFDGCHPRLIDHWAARDSDSQPSLPTWGQWLTLKQVLSLGDELDAEIWRLNGRKGTPGEAWLEAEILGEIDGVAPGLVGMRFGGDNTIRAPSDAAQQWQGWGTALKPAWEPICLARRPLIGTVAENVLTHRTGAINVDGCRVGTEGARNNGRKVDSDIYGKLGTFERVDYDKGRWPANLIHDGSEEVLAGFPDSAGQQGDVRGTEASSPMGGNTFGRMDLRVPAAARGDSGSAARFFYTAKADADDRLGSKHPTVKPLDLMRWLCRLVTPPGGVVLDPFAGTGTTGEAAFREGFRAILVEREAEYQDDIRRRMALALSSVPTRKAAAIKPRPVASDDIFLLGDE